jgi:hypothetical protein
MPAPRLKSAPMLRVVPVPIVTRCAPPTIRPASGVDWPLFVGSVLGLLVVLVLALACAPATAAGQAARPSLGDVVRRIDVGRVLACMGQPDRWRCLGATATSAALELAADKAEAAALAAQQALAGTGADDVDEDALAAELDAALVALGSEIAGGQ